MDDLTPSNSSAGSRTALRTTDHARRLIRRAQLALSALAVLIAVPVGLAVAAADTAGPGAPPAAVRAELIEPALAPEVAVTGSRVPTLARWIGPQGEPRTGPVWADAGLAVGASVVVTVDAGGTVVDTPPAPPDPLLSGVVAGLVTVAVCWVLLGVAGAVWRSRLAARDSRAWARDWARVEPVWSHRKV